GLRLGVPGRDGLDVVGRYRASVLEAQRVLQQNLERVGEPRDVELLLQRVEPVDLELAAPDLQARARSKRVICSHCQSIAQGQLRHKRPPQTPWPDGLTATEWPSALVRVPFDQALGDLLGAAAPPAPPR